MISKIKALSIAEKTIKEKQATTKYQDYTAVELLEENDYFWTFISGSNAMYNDGIVPGAFFVHIDKRDGHILSREEESAFNQKTIKKKTSELQVA